MSWIEPQFMNIKLDNKGRWTPGINHYRGPSMPCVYGGWNMDLAITIIIILWVVGSGDGAG